MPNPRTMVTEVGTGLGMLGPGSLDEVLAARSPVMRNLSPEDWDQLALVRAGGAYDAEFHAAWENGRAFLSAREGLRGRRPEVIEWKGSIRAPGDEVAPVDLRIDHVYLVSCKYLSNILFNVAPGHVFDELLLGGHARRGRTAGGDWYAEVAPNAYQGLYETVRELVRDPDDTGNGGGGGVVSRGRRADLGGSVSFPGLEDSGPAAATVRPASVAVHPEAVLSALPPRAVDLTPAQRSVLARALKPGWPPEAKAAYEALSAEVARRSADRWHEALCRGAAEAMVWRLLRIGGTPYFVLGSSATQSLRLRIATPWDWRQLFALQGLEVFPQAGGQPRVGWSATVRQRVDGTEHVVTGHVEVRWSHGRFGGFPEAKGYLDTPHHLVPGYVPLR